MTERAQETSRKRLRKTLPYLYTCFVPCRRAALVFFFAYQVEAMIDQISCHSEGKKREAHVSGVLVIYDRDSLLSHFFGVQRATPETKT